MICSLQSSQVVGGGLRDRSRGGPRGPVGSTPKKLSTLASVSNTRTSTLLAQGEAPHYPPLPPTSPSPLPPPPPPVPPPVLVVSPRGADWGGVVVAGEATPEEAEG